MSRKAIPVDEAYLRQCISKLETTHKYTTQNELFQDVAKLYNESAAQKITPPVVYLRIRQLGINLVTPKGRRGKLPGSAPVGGVRVKRAEKLAANSDAQKNFEAIRAELKKGYLNPNDGAISGNEARFLPVVKKMESGSVLACVKMMCLQCSSYDTREIANCGIIGCALHSIRPYKQGKVEIVEGE